MIPKIVPQAHHERNHPLAIMDGIIRLPFVLSLSKDIAQRFRRGRALQNEDPQYPSW